MVGEKDDCISVTDATFDLSLEDSSALKAPETVNFLDQDHQINEDTSSTAMGSDTHINGAVCPQLKPISNIFQDYQILGRGETDLHNSTLENLQRSISTLNKACGNNNTRVHHGGTDNFEDEIKKLSSILNLLSDNCALKLNFYKNNYKFVEGLHEASNKENEILRDRVNTAERGFQELEKKYQHLKKEHLQYLQQRGADEMDKAVIKNQRAAHTRVEFDPEPPRYENEAQQLISKQQKEIKEYKRFIKELMERD